MWQVILNATFPTAKQILANRQTVSAQFVTQCVAS